MTIKQGDIVKVVDGSESMFGKQGLVTKALNNGYNVRMLGEGYSRNYWANQVTKLEAPQVGDLVHVLTYGKWQAQQGHVTTISENSTPVLYNLDLDGYEVAFEGYELEVIERVPPLPVVREEGKEIHHSHVEEGDVIRVEIVTRKNQMKSTEINEGEFKYRNAYGTLFSVGSGVLMNAHSLTVAESVEVTLLKKSEDQFTKQVRSFKEGSVIMWEYKLNQAPRVALRMAHGQWHILSPHGAFIYRDEDVVGFIKGSVGSCFEILKEVK